MNESTQHPHTEEPEPQYSQPVKTPGGGILAMGIISVVFCLLWFAGLILAIIATVMSVQYKSQYGSNAKLTAGFVLGIVGLVLSTIFTIRFLVRIIF